MSPNDEQQTQLCLSTPERFDRDWTHNNLMDNSHMPYSDFGEEFHINLWDEHIAKCLALQEWASQHEK